MPDELIGAPCLSEEEVRYICARATALEAAADGAPQDVEWAVASGLPFPDSVYILQHRPETTWATPPDTAPAASGSVAIPAAPEPAFDPVQYALRNVFKVPGA